MDWRARRNAWVVPNDRIDCGGDGHIAAIALSFRNRIGSAATADAAPIDDLPADATDIHWRLPGAFEPNRVYNFRASRESFDAWAKGFANLEEPRTGKYTIMVYEARTSSFEDHVILKGISYTWREGDRGEYAVYDLATGRAYTMPILVEDRRVCLLSRCHS